MAFSDWSTTSANNTNASTGVNWDENMPPSTVNDSGREMMAQLKDAVVDKTSAQTLTNKTLTSPVINGTATGTGTLGGSILVPLARTIRNYVEDSSTSSTLTLNLGDGEVGDYVLLMISIEVTVTASANGDVLYLVGETGTATLTFSGGAALPGVQAIFTSGGVTTEYFTTMLILKVSVAGTVVVGTTVRGASGVTVSSNLLRYAAILFRGA